MTLPGGGRTAREEDEEGLGHSGLIPEVSGLGRFTSGSWNQSLGVWVTGGPSQPQRRLFPFVFQSYTRDSFFFYQTPSIVTLAVEGAVPRGSAAARLRSSRDAAFWGSSAVSGGFWPHLGCFIWRFWGRWGAVSQPCNEFGVIGAADKPCAWRDG